MTDIELLEALDHARLVRDRRTQDLNSWNAGDAEREAYQVAVARVRELEDQAKAQGVDTSVTPWPELGARRRR